MLFGKLKAQFLDSLTKNLQENANLCIQKSYWFCARALFQKFVSPHTNSSGGKGLNFISLMFRFLCAHLYSPFFVSHPASLRSLDDTGQVGLLEPLHELLTCDHIVIDANHVCITHISRLQVKGLGKAIFSPSLFSLQLCREVARRTRNPALFTDLLPPLRSLSTANAPERARSFPSRIRFLAFFSE